MKLQKCEELTKINEIFDNSSDSVVVRISLDETSKSLLTHAVLKKIYAVLDENFNRRDIAKMEYENLTLKVYFNDIFLASRVLDLKSIKVCGHVLEIK